MSRRGRILRCFELTASKVCVCILCWGWWDSCKWANCSLPLTSLCWASVGSDDLGVSKLGAGTALLFPMITQSGCGVLQPLPSFVYGHKWHYHYSHSIFHLADLLYVRNSVDWLIHFASLFVCKGRPALTDLSSWVGVMEPPLATVWIASVIPSIPSTLQESFLGLTVVVLTTDPREDVSSWLHPCIFNSKQIRSGPHLTQATLPGAFKDWDGLNLKGYLFSFKINFTFFDIEPSFCASHFCRLIPGCPVHRRGSIDFP